MPQEKFVEKKREMTALDFAVAQMVYVINMLLCDKVLGWSVNSGLNFEVVEQSQSDVRVRVQPVGWPDGSFITIRLMKPGARGQWSPFEGAINAPHLHNGMAFSFEVSDPRLGPKIPFPKTQHFGGEVLASAIREFGFERFRG